MLTPIKAFLLLFYIFAILGVTMLLVPKKKHQINDEHTLRLFTYKDVFVPEKEEKKDISSVVSTAEQLQQMQTTPEEEAPSPDTTSTDTLDQKEQEKVRIRKIEEVLKENMRIQFPDGDRSVLASFYGELKKLQEDSSLIRILHLGDSQIEGDRITYYLRRKFQQQFGGCGIGLVPVSEPTSSRSTIRNKASKNWAKHLAYGPDYVPEHNRNFGLLGSYFSFTPLSVNIPDSIKNAKDTTQLPDSLVITGDTTEAWFTYSKPYPKYRKDAAFKELKFLYGLSEKPTSLTVSTPQDTLLSQTLDPGTAFRKISIPFDTTFQSVTFHLKSTESPQVYGAAFDCPSGVAVDNVGLRGSSGTEFVRMNRHNLQAQLQQMNVKFILFQFGVNIVPDEKDNYAHLERWYFSQLRRLKSLAPDMDILVVGVTDMAKKEGEIYKSYPNIEMIRDAQRKAAFRAGCAFWDLYEAMGGENSMISWVNASPPLAGKDYTHFTIKGADLVAEMLYNAIILEYEAYKKQTAQ